MSVYVPPTPIPIVRNVITDDVEIERRALLVGKTHRRNFREPQSLEEDLFILDRWINLNKSLSGSVWGFVCSLGFNFLLLIYDGNCSRLILATLFFLLVSATWQVG